MRFALALICAALLLPGTTAAQARDGTRTAAVLVLPAGARAAALGSAYVAAADVDALFYNPAAAGWLDLAGSAAYQRQFDDVGFATAAGAARIGPATFGLAFGYLDFGSIAEVRPDPEYGGQRGFETGETWDAGEAIARAMLAIHTLDGRLSIGAGGGVLLVFIAETGRTTPVFDAGAQYRVSDRLTAGLALRNAGGDLEGARLAPAPLPTELRGGVAWEVPWTPAPSVSLLATADAVVPFGGGPLASAGLEAAYSPDGPVTALLRAGWNGTGGAGGVGAGAAGAGIRIGHVAVDYALQDMDVLGLVHRLGLRWSAAGALSR